MRGVLGCLMLGTGVGLCATGFEGFGIKMVLMGLLSLLAAALGSTVAATSDFDARSPEPFKATQRLASDPFCSYCGRANPNQHATCVGCGAS